MEQIAPLLERLAHQLGTTVDYLWPLLLKQTQIDWVAQAALSVVCFAIPAIIALGALWRGKGLGWKTRYWSQEDRYSSCSTYTWPYVVGIAGGISLLPFLFMVITFSGISRLLVPEAYTIQQLLRYVR